MTNGSSAKKLLYIDSNVFIYALDGRSVFAPAAQTLLANLDQTVLGFSSVITYGEVLRPTGDAKAFLDSLPGLQLLPVDHATAKHAGQLRLGHGLRLADALHIATALACGAELFITNDLPLAKKACSLIPMETLS